MVKISSCTLALEKVAWAWVLFSRQRWGEAEKGTPFLTSSSSPLLAESPFHPPKTTPEWTCLWPSIPPQVSDCPMVSLSSPCCRGSTCTFGGTSFYMIASAVSSTIIPPHSGQLQFLRPFITPQPPLRRGRGSY